MTRAATGTPAWRDARGAAVGEAMALDGLAAARVVLLGETHDRREDHLWQAVVIAGLAARAGGDLVVGLEMLPRRAQPALDAWSAGGLDAAAFEAASGWASVWGFPLALYLPVLELCRDLHLPLLALNVDRPLVSLIGRDGWEALPAAERGWLTPAAPATPDYRRYLFGMTGGARPDRAAQDPLDPAFDRFVRAQGVWDRAFACAIAGALAGGSGQREAGQRGAGQVAALIGRGHLEYGFGTPAQLAALGIAPVRTALPDHPGHPPLPGPDPLADFTCTLRPGPGPDDTGRRPRERLDACRRAANAAGAGRE